MLENQPKVKIEMGVRGKAEKLDNVALIELQILRKCPIADKCSRYRELPLPLVKWLIVFE